MPVPESQVTCASIGENDIEEVLALNQRWVPHVGALDRNRLVAILEQAELALVTHHDGALAGFVIALGAGAEYDSPNYRFFAARHDRFTYVDRIAVAPGTQGLGTGRALYTLVADHATALGAPVVCAEVNLVPPNPDSEAFHRSMGFREVGRQWTYGDTVQVQLLERSLEASPAVRAP